MTHQVTLNETSFGTAMVIHKYAENLALQAKNFLLAHHQKYLLSASTFNIL